jgi:DNA replicative helicase MCM subunit Mcm2 (Cdc46/Mcm family)
MKIKTFLFKIFSSCTDNNLHMKKQNAHDEYETMYTTSKIDSEINEFIKDKNIIDIKINQIHESISGPDRTNKILLLYTISYN